MFLVVMKLKYLCVHPMILMRETFFDEIKEVEKFVDLVQEDDQVPTTEPASEVQSKSKGKGKKNKNKRRKMKIPKPNNGKQKKKTGGL